MALCRLYFRLAVVTAALTTLGATAPALAKSAGNDKDGKPQIKSATALVIDFKNDAVLYEKDADLVRPIASISKVFAALVYIEECKLDPEALHEMSTANRDAARGGDKTKLTTGWSYSHKDLLHAALMRSDNRAMPALSEACGMDPATMALKMTAKSRKLGLTKTFFQEPDGLSAANVSTAREVMVALREAIKVPTLTEIMSKQNYEIIAHKDGRQRPLKIRNTDRLLSKNLAQILGGKTGYTDIARYCLAIAARTFSNREVGMVFLGAEGRFTRFADFTRIIRWLETTDKAPPAVAARSPTDLSPKTDETVLRTEDRTPSKAGKNAISEVPKVTAPELNEQNADQEQDE